MLNYFVCICAERSDKITSVYHPTNMSNSKASTLAVTREFRLRDSSRLSKKENKWLRLFLSGMTSEEIAQSMKISVHTARWHKVRVRRKWGIVANSDVVFVREILRRKIAHWDEIIENFVINK